MNDKISFGKKGEEEAEKFLENQGFKIISKNFRSKLGEIDIIARDGQTVVFVEVKSRSTLLFGYPSEAVNKKKLNSIIKTSQFFIQLNKLTKENIRYDVIEVFFVNNNFKINHLKNITL